MVVRYTLDLDSNKADIIPLEKALKKAASGEHAKAGALFRQFMEYCGKVLAMENAISDMDEAHRRGIKMLNDAKRGHEMIYGTEVEKETWRRQLLDLLDQIRKENPSIKSNRKIRDIAAALSEDVLGQKVSYKTFERAELTGC